MPFTQGKFIKFQNGMRKRIDSLRPKAEESLDLAVDTMMQERVDSFFRVEQGLEEIIKSLLQIEEEIGEIRDLSGAMRLESRLEFVEDHWDDFDSEIRERPRRRRKKISLADMLKAAGGGGGSRRGLRHGRDGGRRGRAILAPISTYWAGRLGGRAPAGQLVQSGRSKWGRGGPGRSG